jgi:hypothetical protein
MFMRPRPPHPPHAAPVRAVSRLTGAVVGASALALLVFGLAPTLLVSWAESGTPAVQHEPAAIEMFGGP